MLASPHPLSFLHLYSLSLSSLGCKALFIVIIFFCLFVHLSEFLSCPFLEWSRVSYKEDCPGFYSFDEISAAEFGFEKLSHSSEVFLLIFSFISSYLMVFASNIHPPSLRPSLSSISPDRSSRLHSMSTKRAANTRTVCISHSTNTFEKGMVPIALPLTMGSRGDWVLQLWCSNQSRRRKTLNSNLLNSA